MASRSPLRRASRALARAATRLVVTMAVRMPMIEMTMRSSMRVKPFLSKFFIGCYWLFCNYN